MNNYNSSTAKSTKSTNSSIIPATSKSPERHTDGRFITATTGKPTISNPSEQYLADKYENKAKAVYSKLPKSLKTITASISYCHHTNTKVAMGTSFTNCPELTKYIRAEHPIFSTSLPLATAIKIYGRSRTTTERYIAMTAILVKTKIINTTDYGLQLDSAGVDLLQSAMDTLIAVLNQSLCYKFTMPIDSLLINEQLAEDTGRLKQQIKDCTQAIDSAVFAAGGSKLLVADSKTTKQLKLDDELALERELNKVLTGYSATGGTKYTPQLNRWTRRVLTRSDMSEDQVTMTLRILNTSPDRLRSGVIEAILPTVKESLCYDDDVSRNNSTLVLRHLQYKIELQLACLYKSGFITDIVEEEVRNDKALTSYTVKARATEDKAIEKIAVRKSGALAELRKRRGI